jgi:CRP-like cAMP-binding protein
MGMDDMGMLSKNTITIKQLENISLFKNLTKTDLHYFLENIPHEIKEYQKGDIIIETGQKLNAIIALLSGTVNSKRTTLYHKEYIINTYKSGEIIGITDCAAGGKTSSNTIVATETSSLLYVDYEKLTHIDENTSGFVKTIFFNIHGILIEELSQNDARCKILYKTSVREKLMTYLDIMSQKRGSKTIKVDMNQAELASYLNISRSNLSTEMNILRKEGIIDYNKKEIKVLNNYE